MKRSSGFERGLAWRRKALLGGWLLASAVLVARAFELQVVEAAEWKARAEGQHRKTSEIAAPRGAILDRDGVPLAISRETFRVSVDPQHVEDRAALQKLLQEVLGISAARAARVTDPAREWAVVPGVFEPSVRQALAGVKGIYLERELRRDYPHGELALGILGRVQEGVGRGGMEEAFDDVLRGRPGRQVLARDGKGREIPGQVFQVEPPVPGGEVTLTIDLDLQEIATQALEEAVEETGALGGDLLVTDPRSGEILAMVSLQEGRGDGLSAINTPSEPGSTLKPFTVAAILKHGRGTLDDSVDVGHGVWTINGRTLHDVHGSGVMSVADALRTSSNVGIAKAALGLTPREQYENLRDFGFGLPTGLPLPGEAAGTLRHPREWWGPSPQSLAIGYEMNVTPVQMAMAYGALANGGRLMEARIVKRVAPVGELVRRYDPQVIRQVLPADLAARIGQVLMDVVSDGTGTAAQLETFHVAGKSGTARAFANGGYQAGRYYASFVGYFPADDPQLVIFVKLDSPQGSYYGGSTAAPVTRATMEAALAARQTPLDRGALLRALRAPVPLAAARPAIAGDVQAPIRHASLEERWAAADQPLEVGRPSISDAEGRAGQAVPVPDVRGLPPRVAVRRLHALGLRVAWEREGPIVGTTPAAGTRLVPGDTIRLRVGSARR
jgi:cell division protein FtsI (penicillin-binding protein 3)